MAISMNGISGAGWSTEHRTSTPVAPVRHTEIAQSVQVGGPPSQQASSERLDSAAETTKDSTYLALQGTMKVGGMKDPHAIDANNNVAQMVAQMFPSQQVSYVRSAYEAGSAAQTSTDVHKVIG